MEAQAIVNVADELWKHLRSNQLGILQYKEYWFQVNWMVPEIRIFRGKYLYRYTILHYNPQAPHTTIWNGSQQDWEAILSFLVEQDEKRQAHIIQVKGKTVPARIMEEYTYKESEMGETTIKWKGGHY